MEPQWGLEHMKTPSGDTVSVQAAKVQHHQMKTAEYVKKGYASPVVYANSAAYAPYSGVPVYNQGVAAPVYNHGVYSYGLHHLGKRDADSDSQYIYSNGVYNSGIYANDTTDMPSPRSTAPLLPQFTLYTTEYTTPMLVSTILASVMPILTPQWSTPPNS